MRGEEGKRGRASQRDRRPGAETLRARRDWVTERRIHEVLIFSRGRQVSGSKRERSAAPPTARPPSNHRPFPVQAPHPSHQSLPRPAPPLASLSPGGPRPRAGPTPQSPIPPPRPPLCLRARPRASHPHPPARKCRRSVPAWSASPGLRQPPLLRPRSSPGYVTPPPGRGCWD